MGETLKVGDSLLTWVPSKQRQPNGSYDYVQDPAGGILSLTESKTVIEIVPRPENEKEAALKVRDLWGRIGNNQGVIDGKLHHKDDKKFGHLFDPGVFYIVEL